MVIVFKTVSQEWKDVKNKVKNSFNRLPEDKKLKLKSDKFVSFFRHSILPKKFVTKFPYVIENTKREYLTGKFRYFLTPKNKMVIKILMRGYFLIYLAYFYAYRFLDDMKKCETQIHDITIFNYFNNNYFSNYYFNNKLLQFIVKGYFLDLKYYDTFIDYFNLYLFHNSKSLYVLLNFEDFKYEEDQYWLLNNPKMLSPKNKTGWKMRTDYFDYIKRKKRYRLFNKFIKHWPWYRDATWNQIEKGDDDELDIKIKREKNILKNHLRLQDNIFNNFIIYEFSLNLNNKILFNYFNLDFFNKIKIFYNKSIKKVKKYPYFLKSTYYSYNLELLKLRKKPFLYTSYKDINKTYNKKMFDMKKHILDIKYFGIKMPFIFFLLYTWYSIFFRRFKYNLYIRGEAFFQEHFSKVYLFLWSNSGGRIAGYNRHKLSPFKYQKLFTIYHLKTYVEVGLFNDWFFFYFSYHLKLKQYIEYNQYRHKSNFLLLLNNSYVLNILNVTVNNNKHYINCFNDFFLRYHYWYELLNGYTLFMSTPVTKFENDFKLGRLSFWQFDLMTERIFTIPLDKKRLLRYLQIKILFEHFFNLYINFKCINLYFLKDLYNLKLLNDYKKHVKIINFYDKIFYVVFLLIDPFFFKYYWKRCFPRKWHKLCYIQYYILANILMVKYKVQMLNYNIPKYNFLMNFFYWRIDSSNFCRINDFNNLKISHNFIVINSIYKTRFFELLKQINFIIKKKYFINLKYFFSYYLSVLKNYYFDFLYYNIEYIMIFFFLNKTRYINLLYNYKSNFFKDFLYSNFIYRYYIYTILLETHHFRDWFHDWDKRIFWIYKSFLKHEGKLFYNKNTLLIY